MKKLFSFLATAISAIAVFFVFGVSQAHAAAGWDLRGTTYTLQVNCSCGTYVHTMTVDSMDLITGAFSGHGTSNTEGINWTMEGTLTNSSLTFTMSYPNGYHSDNTGQVNPDGSWQGTAVDGGGQNLTFITTSGAATPIAGPQVNLSGVFQLNLCRTTQCTSSEIDTLHVTSMDMDTGKFMASGFNNNNPWILLNTRDTQNSFAPFGDFQTGLEKGNQVSFDLTYLSDSGSPQASSVPSTVHAVGTVDSTGTMTGTLYTTDHFNPQVIGSFSATRSTAPTYNISGKNYNLVSQNNLYPNRMTVDSMDMTTGRFLAHGVAYQNNLPTGQTWQLAGLLTGNNISFLIEYDNSTYNVYETGILNASLGTTATGTDSSGGTITSTLSVMLPPIYTLPLNQLYGPIFACTGGCSGNFVHRFWISTFDPVLGDFQGIDYDTGASINGNEQGNHLQFTYFYGPTNYLVNAAGTIDTNGTFAGLATGPGQTFNTNGAPIPLPSYSLAVNTPYTVNFTCTGGCSGTYPHRFSFNTFNNVSGDFTGTDMDSQASVKGTIQGTHVTFTYSLNGYVVTAVGNFDANGVMSGIATAPGQTFNWQDVIGTATRIN